MKKSIKLLEKVVKYEVKLSRRARYARLTIYPGGKVVAMLPWRVPERKIEQFLRLRARWVLDKIEYLKRVPEPIRRLDSRKNFLRYKATAEHLVQRRLSYFNTFYRLAINNVSIRNQKTRWGSCSKKSNLSFNYKIAFLPLELVDYVVVHELCHVKELNHSGRFWNLVTETIPNYKERRRRLKHFHLV
jgi:predicted metal-dependent hydrolase